MLAAAVVTAGVPSFAVGMVVMVAADIGVIAQIAIQQCMHRCIRLAMDATVELDTRLGQCHLCTAADAAADQRVYAVLHQKSGQRTVTAAVGVHHISTDDFAIRSFINLELFRMAEVLKNLTILIGNCDFHR